MALRNGAAGVYEIVHVPTGRRYVGSSIDMRARWRKHRVSLRRCGHHSIALQRAWSKYGGGEFSFRPLLICNREMAIFYEQRAIDVLRPEFKCSPTAGSQLGYRHRAETVQKMKAAAVGRPSSFKGFRHSTESRRAIAENRKGKPSGPFTETRRRKISEALKGRPVSPERRAMIAATLAGRSTGRGALTSAQVKDIRRLHAMGCKQCDIAREVGAKKGHVANVINRNGYTWVT